jgi:hypothetical protein
LGGPIFLGGAANGDGKETREIITKREGYTKAEHAKRCLRILVKWQKFGREVK